MKQYEIERVSISVLKPHPKNYRAHGPAQLEHIVSSLKEHGFYRNVVIARDGTILAGHGVVEASQSIGLDSVPCIRLDIDPDDTRALKVLTGDNEMGRLGEVDDRLLSENLREIAQRDTEGLLGTGFDERMLANLVFVTRNSDEIKDFDAAKEWVGLPSYEQEDEKTKNQLCILISFNSREDRDRYIEETKLKLNKRGGDKQWSTVWPYEENLDRRHVRFEAK